MANPIGKLQQLKSLFPAEEWDETAMRKFAQWEQSIINADNRASFLEHPVAQDIVEKLKKIIHDTNIRLTSDRNAETKKLIDQKAAYVWILNLIAKDPQKELDSVELDIDREITAIVGRRVADRSDI